MTHLRLDAGAMRVVAKELDVAAQLTTRVSGVVPTLADGYDLPPDVADEVRASLESVSALMRRATGVTDGLGHDLRARADITELADQAGQANGLPEALKHRLYQVVENFECPLDDPATKLMFDAMSASVGGANLASGRLEDALGDLVDGQVADHIREYGNEKLDGCQPPMEMPELPPPPPPPPPEPGFLDKLGDAIDELGDDIGEALPAPGEDRPGLPFPPIGPRGFPRPAF